MLIGPSPRSGTTALNSIGVTNGVVHIISAVALEGGKGGKVDLEGPSASRVGSRAIERLNVAVRPLRAAAAAAARATTSTAVAAAAAAAAPVAVPTATNANVSGVAPKVTLLHTATRVWVHAAPVVCTAVGRNR